MKIDEMADIFLKSAEHEKNTFFTLAPPNNYMYFVSKSIDRGVKS